MTTFAQAIDFHWDHSLEEIPWHFRFRSQPLLDRLIKIVDDYIVYFFAYILGVHTHKAVVKDTTAYQDYISEKKFPGWISNSKVILVLNGDQDIAVNPKVFEALGTQKKAQLVVLKVLDFKYLKTTFEELLSKGNTLDALWIRANGTPFTLTFGPGEYGTLDVTPYSNLTGTHASNEDQFDEIVFREQQERAASQINHAFLQTLPLLAPNAPIILESCSTGQQTPQKTNIQSVLAKNAQGHKVFAPTREALPLEERCFSQGAEEFKVTFEGFRMDHTFSPHSLLGRLHAVWNAYRDHREDITSCMESTSFSSTSP